MSRAENKLLKTELIHVKATALRLEMYARRNNILIHGVEAPHISENSELSIFLTKALGLYFWKIPLDEVCRK